MTDLFGCGLTVRWNGTEVGSHCRAAQYLSPAGLAAGAAAGRPLPPRGAVDTGCCVCSGAGIGVWPGGVPAAPWVTAGRPESVDGWAVLPRVERGGDFGSDSRSGEWLVTFQLRAGSADGLAWLRTWVLSQFGFDACGTGLCGYGQLDFEVCGGIGRSLRAVRARSSTFDQFTTCVGELSIVVEGLDRRLYGPDVSLGAFGPFATVCNELHPLSGADCPPCDCPAPQGWPSPTIQDKCTPAFNADGSIVSSGLVSTSKQVTWDVQDYLPNVVLPLQSVVLSPPLGGTAPASWLSGDEHGSRATISWTAPGEGAYATIAYIVDADGAICALPLGVVVCCETPRQAPNPSSVPAAPSGGSGPVVFNAAVVNVGAAEQMDPGQIVQFAVNVRLYAGTATSASLTLNIPQGWNNVTVTTTAAAGSSFTWPTVQSAVPGSTLTLTSMNVGSGGGITLQVDGVHDGTDQPTGDLSVTAYGGSITVNHTDTAPAPVIRGCGVACDCERTRIVTLFAQPGERREFQFPGARTLGLVNPFSVGAGFILPYTQNDRAGTVAWQAPDTPVSAGVAIFEESQIVLGQPGCRFVVLTRSFELVDDTGIGCDVEIIPPTLSEADSCTECWGPGVQRSCITVPADPIGISPTLAVTASTSQTVWVEVFDAAAGCDIDRRCVDPLSAATLTFSEAGTMTVSEQSFGVQPTECGDVGTVEGNLGVFCRPVCVCVTVKTGEPLPAIVLNGSTWVL